MAILFDLDGVFYNGEVPIHGASETLAWVRKQKIPYLFLSNTTSRSRTALAEKLLKMGILVRTGKFNTNDLSHGIKPAFIMDSIADLPSLWEQKAGSWERETGKK